MVKIYGVLVGWVEGYGIGLFVLNDGKILIMVGVYLMGWRVCVGINDG